MAQGLEGDIWVGGMRVDLDGQSARHGADDLADRADDVALLVGAVAFAVGIDLADLAIGIHLVVGLNLVVGVNRVVGINSTFAAIATLHHLLGLLDHDSRSGGVIWQTRNVDAVGLWNAGNNGVCAVLDATGCGQVSAALGRDAGLVEACCGIEGQGTIDDGGTIGTQGTIQVSRSVGGQGAIDGIDISSFTIFNRCISAVALDSIIGIGIFSVLLDISRPEPSSKPTTTAKSVALTVALTAASCESS